MPLLRSEVMRAWQLATMAALLVGCGTPDAAVLAPWMDARAGLGSGDDVDPLLARARAGLQEGRLDAQSRRELLTSELPQHARARRVLLAFESQPAAPAAPASEEMPSVPQLQLSTPPPDPKAPPQSNSSSASVARRVASRPASGSRRAPAPSASASVSTTLRGVGLRSTSRGAALTLDGTRGLVVGVANQPRSGIVHLVVEAGASAKALRSRPKVAGARVTSVRRTGRSVFITMSLEPGWSLGGIVKTKGGARVNLRRSA